MRQDQGVVSLTVDGRQIPITFSKRGGGTADSEENKYAPGGNQPEKAQGGRQTVENVTLAGEYQPEIHQTIVSWMESRRGIGKATCVEQPTDDEGDPAGAPETWTGVLKSVTRGEYEAGSNDTRELELEISTNGVKT